MKRAEEPSVSPRRAFRNGRGTNRKPKPGFTLVEVLLALAMAAVGFGVVLHSLGRQMALVAGSIERHQMLMHASQALETTMANGAVEQEEEPTREPVGSFGDEGDEDGRAEATRFFYKVEAGPVTADPRVEQVSVTVEGNRGLVRMSAYRLRVRRE